MKITLYLMTQKGFEVLKSLVDRGYNSLISVVVVGRDNKVEQDFADLIISLCKENSICFKERQEFFISESDYYIAISWRWLIPITNANLIVLHDSLLPKYRGFAPLVSMLCNRENEIGVSAIFASNEYDKGDVILQSSIPIKYPIKISHAIDLLSGLYSEIMIKIFYNLKNGIQLKSSPQVEEDASYSLWRGEDDYNINWGNSSDDILNFINSVSYPYRGASTFINNTKKIRVLEAELVPDVKIVNRDVGKVIFVQTIYPIIVCGQGLICLLKVIDDETNENLLPFKNFRVRLSGNKIY